MADTLKLEITVDDKGTPIIQRFADGTENAIKKVELSSAGMTKGFEKTWAGIAAGSAGAIYALQQFGAWAGKAWDMAKIGADYEEQRGILDNLGRKYGQTADEIVAAMDKAADSQIANADLMKTALAGVAKGLKPEQLIELSKAALILGDSVGVSAKQALDDLTQALETGRTKGLKNYLGTTLDLKTAFGDLESKMTEVEKSQAMYNLTMIASAELQAQQTTAVDGAADSIAQIEKKYADATLAVARFAKSLVVSTIDIFSSTDAMDNMSNTVDSLTFDRGGQAEALGGKPAAGNDKAEKAKAAAQAQVDALKKQLEAREGIKKAAKEGTDTAKKAAADLAALQKKSFDAYLEGIGKEWDETERVWMERVALKNKEADETEKLQAKSFEGYLKALEAESDANEAAFIARGQLELKSSEERTKAERDLYSDLRGYEQDYFDQSKELIEDQARRYRALGVSEVAVAKWVAEETEKAELKKLKASEDWMDGVKAHYMESKRDAKSWADYSYDAVKTFSTESRKALSDNLFSAFKGDFDNLESAWESLLDVMLRKLTDSVADMIVTWTEANVTMAGIDAASDYLGGAIGSIGSAALDWLGLAVGQWEVPEDKLALLHAGEMVVPKSYASMIRDLMDSSGGTLGPNDEAFAAALAAQQQSWREDNPHVAAQMDSRIGSNARAGAIKGAMPGILMGNIPAAFAGGFVGGVQGSLYGILASLLDYAGITDVGALAGNLDHMAQSFAQYTGMSVQDVMGYSWGTEDNWGGGGGYGGYDPGEGSSHDPGGMGDEPGEWRYGGISRGPGSGYMARLHGTEAVVPLPGGRSIPVEMRGGSGGFNGTIQVFLDGQELPGRVKVIADGVIVERNSRGVNPTQRVYN